MDAVTADGSQYPVPQEMSHAEHFPSICHMHINKLKEATEIKSFVAMSQQNILALIM